MAGMSRDLGRDIWGIWEELYARKLWADLLFLSLGAPNWQLNDLYLYLFLFLQTGIQIRTTFN